jgi:hypothetical protein
MVEFCARLSGIFSPLLYRLSYLGLECGSAYLSGSGSGSESQVTTARLPNFTDVEWRCRG